MELWQSLLVAFGGNAALLLVVGFLGRSLMSTIITKDLEKFKADLQVAAVEHQVRFSKLHEKRAQVLADLYTFLVVATWEATHFANPMEWAGEPDKKTQYVSAINAITAYFRFFDQHRIWLPADLCGPLEDFAKQLRTPTIGFGVYLKYEHPNERTANQKFEAWNKAWEAVQTDIPKLRTAIEVQFRTLLGAGLQDAG